MNRPHRQHSRLLWINLPAHDRLRHQHELRCQHDRILACLRSEPCPPIPRMVTFERCRTGQQRPTFYGNSAGRNIVRVVL